MGRARKYLAKAKAEVRHGYNRGLRWVVANIPPGARTLLGLLLIAGGFLAVLPVFGLWMIPLGIAVILLDVAMIRRWWRGRPVRWYRKGSQRHKDG